MNIRLPIITVCTALLAPAAWAGNDPHWSYTGPTGTSHWAKLDQDYKTCALGKHQSPIDIRTGKTLWQDTLPAGGQANPMFYEQNGRQYVVIMAGGHHFMKTPEGDYLIAYALPEKK